jgi:hypothetical protein
MKLKTPSLPLGLLATTLLLTGCATVSRAPRGSLFPPSGVLHLQPNQTYQAQAVETWHSAARYQALELRLIDATSAIKHLQNQ